jgi:hypothetical protein
MGKSQKNNKKEYRVLNGSLDLIEYYQIFGCSPHGGHRLLYMAAGGWGGGGEGEDRQLGAAWARSYGTGGARVPVGAAGRARSGQWRRIWFGCGRRQEAEESCWCGAGDRE